jgi:hypothetical protein
VLGLGKETIKKIQRFKMIFRVTTSTITNFFKKKQQQQRKIEIEENNKILKYFENILLIMCIVFFFFKYFPDLINVFLLLIISFTNIQNTCFYKWRTYRAIHNEYFKYLMYNINLRALKKKKYSHVNFKRISRLLSQVDKSNIYINRNDDIH